MPYSGADDTGLPDYVKKLGEKKRAQWVEVFNSSHSAGDSEADSFKKANGVVKRKKDYYYEPEYYPEKKLFQFETNYKPYGAVDGIGCATCWFYQGKEECYLNYGTISPTGRCDLHFPVPGMDEQGEPMPMMDNKSIIDRIKSFLGFAAGVEIKSEPEFTGLRFDQTEKGLRFFTTFSNCFKDAHGEIITDGAHQEYVTWVNETKQYPELWLWHSGPKSKWGTIDFVDYADGFVVASGLVDPGKEYIAEAIQKEKVKVSHGFVGLISKAKYIVKYRSLEVSTLPAWAAANEWTDFNLSSIKDTTMPFSDTRKKWLQDIAGVKEDQIAEMEAGLAKLGASLKESGIEWKGKDEDDMIDLVTIHKSITDLTTLVTEVKTKQTELETVIKAQNEKIAGFETQVVEASKSIDTKVADLFVAEVAKLPTGFKASETAANVTEGEKAKKDTAWFGDIVASALK